jgi:tetratricopeptide (TPR) repeat protein
VIDSTDSNDVEKRKALETLERAVSYDSRRPWPLVFLGAAHYRLGVYEDALATLTRAKKIQDDIIDDIGVEPGLAIYYGPGPTNNAFSAMALHQLGRDKEANAILQQLRSGFERWFSAEDPLFGPPFRIRGPSLELIIEVERLFARGDSTLLSIWEHIEENRLDEASELIEKERQSKNADYVSHMEGAIKLIEALRNLK